MTIKPIPTGYHTVTPYFLVLGANQFVEFLKQAFDAKEISSTKLPDGTIMHAEIRMGDSMVMVAETRGDYKPMPSAFYLYVPDTDAIYTQALQAGATSLMEPADQFYGDRNAGVQDSFGNQWWIATHQEDVSAEEIQQRAEALFVQPQAMA